MKDAVGCRKWKIYIKAAYTQVWGIVVLEVINSAAQFVIK